MRGDSDESIGMSRGVAVKEQRANRGFSLIELVTVIAVFSILALVGLPMLLNALSKYNLRAETRELVTNFKRAKVEAVKTNRNVVLAFTKGAGTDPGWYRVFADVNGNGVFDVGTDDLVLEQYVRDKVWIEDQTFSGDKTWYTPRGMVPPAQAGRCELKNLDGDKRTRVIVSPTGATRVEVSNNAGVTWSAQ